MFSKDCSDSCDSVTRLENLATPKTYLVSCDLVLEELNDPEVRELSSLLGLLEILKLVDSKVDERRWKVEFSGAFSC